MHKSWIHKVLYILLAVFLFIVVGTGVLALWLSYNYKQVIAKRLPAMIAKATDSIYHVSFSDIKVDLGNRKITITDLKLWPDKKHAAALLAQHRRIPNTLHTISIPLLEADGMEWGNILSNHSLDARHLRLHRINWVLDCKRHPEDSLFIKDKEKDPFLTCITAGDVEVLDPDMTYKYQGDRRSFSCNMKGGSITLNKWAYNHDQRKDTSQFLFANNGKLRFHEVVFLKSTGRYTIKKPEIDFETGESSVTLKNVHIKNMVNQYPETGVEKSIYNLNFPSITLNGFNWNKLIHDNTLYSSKVIASRPDIVIRHFDKNDIPSSKMGCYPHQLLLQVALQTNLAHVNVDNGHVKYTAVTIKNTEAVLDFSHITGRFSNVTNIDSVIAKNKTCTLKLSGKFMNKADVSSTFNLFLGDTSGRFNMNGIVENLDGDQVLQPAQALTLVEVTSFHLNKMDMHVYGDETYAKGDFTILYQDLKISMLKFKSDHRKGSKGPFSFLGSSLILYPSNPAKNNEIRKVSTSFARDPRKGFVNALWKNIFRGAQKTAARNDKILDITGEPESDPGEKPKKKGFFKRLFGKKN